MVEVKVQCDEREARLVASGDIDFTATDRFNAAIDDAFRSQAPRVVIDLRDTTFFDSAGIAALVRAHRLATTKSAELVVEPGPARRRLELTCVDRLLGIASPSGASDRG